MLALALSHLSVCVLALTLLLEEGSSQIPLTSAADAYSMRSHIMAAFRGMPQRCRVPTLDVASHAEVGAPSQAHGMFTPEQCMAEMYAVTATYDRTSRIQMVLSSSCAAMI
jgi:hypothetical protein